MMGISGEWQQHRIRPVSMKSLLFMTLHDEVVQLLNDWTLCRAISGGDWTVGHASVRAQSTKTSLSLRME